MKRKQSPAKTVSPEDLMKSCGVLAKEAGLTSEQRVFFSEDDELSAGWLAGWTTQLNEDLVIEVDAATTTSPALTPMDTSLAGGLVRHRVAWGGR